MGVWILATVIVLAGTTVAAFAFMRRQSSETAEGSVDADRIASMRSENIEQSVANLMTAQSELAGRISQLAEAQTRSQAGMMKSLEERLDAVKLYMGRSLTEQTDRTSQTLHQLHTRLSMIDEAQKKISSLSDNVSSLQNVLGAGNARGLFGEMQMRDLVTSCLPPSAYTFQKTLANGRTADCLIELPNPPGPMVIDARFPLESYYALREAKTEEDKAQAERGFRNAVLKHVVDIAERYIIAGDTAESALMFLPSEAVYAELHANYPDVVEKSFRARVWIVSPTTMMATLNTVRAVLKDARMREQAQIIHKETGLMLDDVSRLQKRVLNLQAHFGQTEKDVREVLIAADKIARRAERIEEVQIGGDTSSNFLQQPAPAQIGSSAPGTDLREEREDDAEMKGAKIAPAPTGTPLRPAVVQPKVAAAAPAKSEAPATFDKTGETSRGDDNRDPASVWANLWLSAMNKSASSKSSEPVKSEKPLVKSQALAGQAAVKAPEAAKPRVPNAFLPDPIEFTPSRGTQDALKKAIDGAKDVNPSKVKTSTPVPPVTDLSFADIAEDLAEFGVPLAPLGVDTGKLGKSEPKKAEPAPVKPSLRSAAASNPNYTGMGKPPQASKLYLAGLNPFVTPAKPKTASEPSRLPTDSKIELPKSDADKKEPKPVSTAGHAIYFPAMSLAPTATKDAEKAEASKKAAAGNPLEPKPYVRNTNPAKSSLSGKPADGEKRSAGDSSIPGDDFDDYDDRPTIWPLV